MRDIGRAHPARDPDTRGKDPRRRGPLSKRRQKQAPSFVYELHNDLALQLQSLSRCLFRQYLRLYVLPILVE